MNYAKIDTCDMNNGDGIRVTLWVSGCPLHCKGCHNQQLWDRNYGKEFTHHTFEKLCEFLEKEDKYISGISILGGEPLAPYNKFMVLTIIKCFKDCFPDKDIWLWTGYNEDEIDIQELKDKGLDVLICGRYEEDKKINGKYFGSSNQKIIKLKGDGI